MTENVAQQQVTRLLHTRMILVLTGISPIQTSVVIKNARIFMDTYLFYVDVHRNTVFLFCMNHAIELLKLQ